MDIPTLIGSLVVLIAILSILIFLLMNSYRDKKTKKRTHNIQKDATAPSKTDFNSLKKIIKDKNTPTEELSITLDQILKYHGNITKKLGLRVHPDFDKYVDILFAIGQHPNINKEIILKFDKELGKLNPEYKKEIYSAISKGLSSRV